MKIYFDSHAHMNGERLREADRDRIAADIEASEVAYVIDVGYDLESSMIAASNAKKYPWCYAAVGFHPHDAKDMDDDSLAMTKGLTKKDKVVAVGEIGLDFYRNLSPRDDQFRCFRKQIHLALELNMPIIIHDRDANNDVMNVLKEEGVFSKSRTDLFPKHPITGRPDAKLLMHCFSGSKELAMQYVKLGATISIAGPVTYSNARKVIEVVDAVPLEHLLIETDSPYLTPEPFRGKPNSSPLVKYVAMKIAEIKGVTVEETARVTCENAKRFFGIQ